MEDDISKLSVMFDFSSLQEENPYIELLYAKFIEANTSWTNFFVQEYALKEKYIPVSDKTGYASYDIELMGFSPTRSPDTYDVSVLDSLFISLKVPKKI